MTNLTDDEAKELLRLCALDEPEAVAHTLAQALPRLLKQLEELRAERDEYIAELLRQKLALSEALAREAKLRAAHQAIIKQWPDDFAARTSRAALKEGQPHD